MMRSFEERKAEIFRRSENRIKDRRRKRNRVLGLCASLCLILTVWSVVALPSLLSADKKGHPQPERVEETDGVQGNDTAYIRLEVTSLQSLISKNDSGEVLQIYDWIRSTFACSDELRTESAEEILSDALPPEAKEDDFDASTTVTTLGEYRIIFTAENGFQASFTLVGDKLIDEATKRETVLTSDQRSDLLNMLGLVVTEKEGS